VHVVGQSCYHVQTAPQSRRLTLGEWCGEYIRKCGVLLLCAGVPKVLTKVLIGVVFCRSFRSLGRSVAGLPGLARPGLLFVRCASPRNL